MGKRRDEPGNTEQLRLLKQQNRILKRQLAQARKQIIRLLSQVSDKEETSPVPLKDDLKCPKCSSGPMTELSLVGKAFLICKACKHRQLKQ